MRRRAHHGRKSRWIFTLAAIAAVAGLGAAAARWLALRLQAPRAAVTERFTPGTAGPAQTPRTAEEITNEERRALEAVLGGPSHDQTRR